MIEQLQGFPENVVAFAGRGQVTKADYVSILVPAVEKAFASHDRLRLYYELGADFRASTPMRSWKISRSECNISPAGNGPRSSPTSRGSPMRSHSSAF